MVPPPALTVLISIIGTAMSWPSILPRLASAGSPSRISATSQDVPPMSKVMRLRDAERAARRDARRHAAGRSRQHGRDRLAPPPRNVAMPPFDCMTYFCGVAMPAPPSRRSRLAM